MIAIRVSLVLGFFLAGFPAAPLLSQALPESLLVNYTSYNPNWLGKCVRRSTPIKGDRIDPSDSQGTRKITQPHPASLTKHRFPTRLAQAMKNSNSSAFWKMRAKSSGSSQPDPDLFNPRLPIQNILENHCHGEPSGIGIPGFQPGTPKSLIRRMFGSPSKSLAGYWPNTTAAIYELIPNQVSLGFLFDIESDLLRQTEVSFSDAVEAKVIVMTLNSLLGCKLNDDIKQGLQQVRLRESRRYDFNLESIEGVIERDSRDRLYIGIWDAELH